MELTSERNGQLTSVEDSPKDKKYNRLPVAKCLLHLSKIPYLHYLLYGFQAANALRYNSTE